MKKSLLACSSAFFIFFQFLFPQNSSAQFTVGAELRPRLELRNGYRTLPVDDPDKGKPAFFISQRSRISLGYIQKKFSLKVTFQDVRTWGDEELNQDVPSTGLHEAYGQIQFSDQTSLRIGRQEFVYDDERLLGNSNWGQQSKSFDAALFKYSHDGWKVDAAGAFNQQKENLLTTDYFLNSFKVLDFVHAGREVENKYKAYLVFINDGFQGTDTTKELFMRYTYGANGEYNFGAIKMKAMVYGQSGMDKSNTKISAYMFSLQAYYTQKKFMAGIGTDYLSGDDATDTADDKIRTFNTLYATNHPLYGHIDYFENIPADTKNGGLSDSYLKLRYAFLDKFAAYLDYHYFMLPGKVMDAENPGKALSAYLGSEIDLWFIYKITDGLEFRPGVSTMIATESMNIIKGGGNKLNGFWGYLQLTFNPTLFKFEAK